MLPPPERLKVLLFLALFFGAVGFLSTLLSCGTEYWLLATETCSRPGQSDGGSSLTETSNRKVGDGVRIFHEGLFWRCSFMAPSHDYSIWDLWTNHPPSQLCQTAFLFPFPVNEPEPSRVDSRGLPREPYEHHSAIVFRTFWSIFLVTGLMAIVIGEFVVICASPLGNFKLFKVGGALQFSGGMCLLAVVVMYLIWLHVLDTLEQFAHHKSVSGCPSFHLRIQHGPSFLLAPVSVFFSLLAGLLFILVGRSIHGRKTERKDKDSDLRASDV